MTNNISFEKKKKKKIRSKIDIFVLKKEKIPFVLRLLYILNVCWFNNFAICTPIKYLYRISLKQDSITKSTQQPKNVQKIKMSKSKKTNQRTLLSNYNKGMAMEFFSVCFNQRKIFRLWRS
jgi:hypothetical protein